MRISFLIVCTIVCSLQGISQAEFALFAGPQTTSANYKIGGTKQDTKMKYGFQLGAGLKVPFEEKLFFAPAVFYSLKGYKVTFNKYAYPPEADAKDNNTTIHTFEMAFLLQYDFSSEPGHVFIKAGPSLDFQLSGKETFNSKSINPPVTRSMKFSFADYGHFSANLLAQLGYEMASGFFIAGQYTHGIASISNTDGGPSIKHRAYGISIGKYLNRKK